MNNLLKKINAFVKNKWTYILLAIFLIILFFLPRYFEYKNRFNFDWDQEKMAYESKRIIKDHKLTLIGPRANNDRGFFLGPQFTYLIIPFFIFSNLHPNALVYFLIVYNFVFFLAAFFILKKIFNMIFASFFLLMWGVNDFLIRGDTSIFVPLIIPLGIILTIFCLYKIYNQREVKWWLILGLVIGFFANMHFQFVFIGLFAFVFTILSLKQLKLTYIKVLGFCFSLFLMFSPLLLFDLRHNFLNSRLFISFFTEKDPNVSRFWFVWFPVFQNFIVPFVFSKISLIAYLFYFGVLGILTYLSYQKKAFGKSFYLSFMILWIMFPIFFSIYGKRPSEYYFNFLYPFIIICLIDFVFTAKQYLLGLLFLSIYLWINMYTFLPYVTSFGQSFSQKEQAVLRIKEITDVKPCDIAFNVPLGRNVGYKYLFEYYNIRQIGNWKSCVIDLNITPRIGDEVFGFIGLKIPKLKIVK